ncbi:MAG: hypothetical protein Q3998_07180 [Porphyromonas sp.]|nr:hypothetical protein [Porphyromonas sp.]
MKKISLFTLLLLLFAACSSESSKQANALVEEAKNALEAGQLEDATLLADSLHRSFPKEIESRKAVELIRKEAIDRICTRDIAYIDSLRPIKLEEISKLEEELFTRIENKEFADETLLRFKGFDGSSVSSAPFLDIYIKEKDMKIQLISGCASAGKGYGHVGFLIVDEKSGLEFRSDTIEYDGGVNYRFADGGVTYERITYPEQNALDLAALLGSMDMASGKIKVRLLSANNKAPSFVLSSKAMEAIKGCGRLILLQKELEEMEKHYTRTQQRHASI